VREAVRTGAGAGSAAASTGAAGGGVSGRTTVCCVVGAADCGTGCGEVPAVVVLLLGVFVGAVASGGRVTVGVVGVAVAACAGDPVVTSCGSDSEGAATSCAVAEAAGMAVSAKTAAIAVRARGE
jgi:hypothetical protein